MRRTWRRLLLWLLGENPQPTPVYRYNGFSFQDWQNSPDHIRWLINKWQEPEWRDFITVLKNAAPDGSSSDPSYELGRHVEHQRTLQLIVLMSQFPKQQPGRIEEEYPSTVE